MASGATVCQLLARYGQEHTDPNARAANANESDTNELNVPVVNNDASNPKEIND